MAYKTPGVYVEEITTLAPSVVAVETAIPAFIGYTETGDRRHRRQSPIRSDAHQVAAGVSDPLRRRLRAGDVPSRAGYPRQATPSAPCRRATPAARERRYRLFNSVRHYYANGGGPCYIVSVGSYADAPALGNTTTPAGLLGGLSRVEPVDDPTLLVFPDAVSLSVADMGSLQVAALAQCEKLQDRFVIMDLVQGDQPVSLSLDPDRELPPERRHQQPQIRRRVLPLGPDDLRADGALSPVEPGDAGLGRDSQRHNR